MLTRQQIIAALQNRGFVPLASPQSWRHGALYITVLDAPRAVIVNALGTIYVAFASVYELEQQLTSLLKTQTLS